MGCIKWLKMGTNWIIIGKSWIPFNKKVLYLAKLGSIPNF